MASKHRTAITFSAFTSCDACSTPHGTGPRMPYGVTARPHARMHRYAHTRGTRPVTRNGLDRPGPSEVEHDSSRVGLASIVLTGLTRCPRGRLRIMDGWMDGWTLDEWGSHTMRLLI